MVATDHSASAAPTTGTTTQRWLDLFEVKSRSGLSPRFFKRKNAIQQLSIGLPARGARIRDIHSPLVPPAPFAPVADRSKDGQCWLTNPSPVADCAAVDTKKEPSMVFATVEMLSLTCALLPVFAIQVKETLRQVSASLG